MEGVSWNAAQAWLAAVGDGLCLPSSEEWEYACSRGSRSKFYWGDDMDHSRCLASHPEPQRLAAPSLRAGRSNAFGLVDMIGNVVEWCRTDAAEPGEVRIFHGACSLDSANGREYSPVSGGIGPDAMLPRHGFRLARIID